MIACCYVCFHFIPFHCLSKWILIWFAPIFSFCLFVFALCRAQFVGSCCCYCWILSGPARITLLVFLQTFSKLSMRHLRPLCSLAQVHSGNLFLLLSSWFGFETRGEMLQVSTRPLGWLGANLCRPTPLAREGERERESARAWTFQPTLIHFRQATPQVVSERVCFGANKWKAANEERPSSGNQRCRPTAPPTATTRSQTVSVKLTDLIDSPITDSNTNTRLKESLAFIIIS